jgi:hypothetical protein
MLTRRHAALLADRPAAQMMETPRYRISHGEHA